MTDFIPSFLPFEQDRLDRERAVTIAAERDRKEARDKVIAERLARKKKEAMEKASRKAIRAIKDDKRRREGALWAVCGYNSYSGGSGWTHCVKCRQPLIYRPFKEANENPQECNPPSRESVRTQREKAA